MKLPTLSGILKKSSFVWVLSVVIAVMAWFVVINTAPDQERLVTVREKEADGRVRKYYRITKKGRRALEEKKAAWKYFAEQVDAVVNSASLA